jgi:hypothetical protein
VYREEGSVEKEKEYVRLAYQKTIEQFPSWQEKLIWGFTEHRPFMRSILGMATLSHSEGNKKEAEKLYKELLKTNPYDNQGVRYLLAALYAGFDPHIVDDLTEEGNRKQNWNKLNRLLSEQNKKHTFWKAPRG